MLKKLNKKDLVFIGCLILVHLVFFLLAWLYKRIYMGDSFEYIYEALNIKQYGFFYSGNPAMPILPEYMTQRQPLYPLFLMVVYFFSVNNWIVIVLQNLLSIFNIFITRRLLFRMGYKPKYDWLLLLLVITYPAQFMNANTIAPDILLQTFTLLYVVFFFNFLKSKHIYDAIKMSLVLIAGFMVKPVLYPFVAVHIILLIITAIHLKIKLQRPVLISVIPLCAFLLYNYWNYTRTGKFHFSSNTAFNSTYYFYKYLSHKDGIDSAESFLKNERSIIASKGDFNEQYDYATGRGLELLKQNFIPYSIFHLQHSARIFIEPGKAELDLFTGNLTYGKLYSKEQTGFYATIKSKGWGGVWDYARENPSLIFIIIVLLFNVIRLVGFMIMIRDKNLSLFFRLFVLMFVLYFAIAAGPIANTRYFLPVSLLLTGCSVIGWIRILQRKKNAIPIVFL